MSRCLEGCTCGRHVSYTRTTEHRAASSTRRRGTILRPIVERFWAKVSKAGPDECWLWTGAVEVAGYGKLYIGRNATGTARFVKAHRYSWELAHERAIPDGLYTLHSCDTPRCVNPAHLRVGTNADNIADRADRKRGKEHRQQGESNDNAKLTEAQVREIITELQRLPRRSQVSIAEQFGVKQPQVSRIMLRQSWAHLWDE
jgi:predicted XRE-type DNA-binding protein